MSEFPKPIYSSEPSHGDRQQIYGWALQQGLKLYNIFNMRGKIFRLICKLVNQSYNIHAFLVDAVDVTSAMYYNEYNKIILSGYNPDELNTFFCSEYCLNFPEDGIYCLKGTYESEPEKCDALITASLQGWDYAFKNTEETLEVILRYCSDHHLQTNITEQKWMLEKIKGAMEYQSAPAPEEPGKLILQDFRNVTDILKSNNMISDVPDYNDFTRGWSRE